MTVAVAHYAVEGTGLPPLRIAAVADLHVCWPAMPLRRVRRIVGQTNQLGADLICLLGDYAGHNYGCITAQPERVAEVLIELRAPLGVYGVFGNHDWRDDRPAQRARRPSKWHRAFASAGLRMLINQTIRIDADGGAFNLAGLESQRAFKIKPRFRRRRTQTNIGGEDLDRVIAERDPTLPMLLMAHEPDIFPDLPDDVGLTLCGHTHGGQIRPFGKAWTVPSRYGTRYAYGHFREGARQMIVSGGIGTTTLPLRYRMPPELALVETV